MLLKHSPLLNTQCKILAHTLWAGVGAEAVGSYWYQNNDFKITTWLKPIAIGTTLKPHCRGSSHLVNWSWCGSCWIILMPKTSSQLHPLPFTDTHTNTKHKQAHTNTHIYLHDKNCTIKQWHRQTQNHWIILMPKTSTQLNPLPHPNHQHLHKNTNTNTYTQRHIHNYTNTQWQR